MSFTMQCRVCAQQSEVDFLKCRELMFGTREEFDYCKCPACGCLQIAQVPGNMAAYYPANYYSFAGTAPAATVPGSKARLWMRRALANLRLCEIGFLRNAARRISRGEPLPAWLKALPKPVFTGSSILDVGCGAGRDLLHLQRCGFHKLAGVDPYLAASIHYPGITIAKQSLESVTETFDLVTLHHVFEHLADPLGVLKLLSKIVKPNGQILIRIPLADSYPAQKYGAAWVQLDAPRHFFLHTRASMETAARQTGFRIAKVVYDSDAFQFWGSEQYVREIPLFAPQSYAVSPKDSIFTPAEIEQFAARAEELNAKEQGDQACFVLQLDPKR